MPADRLQARVEISNVDIGFIKEGLPVNVSVDSFSGEFGYIKGKLIADLMLFRLTSVHLSIAFLPQYF